MREVPPTHRGRRNYSGSMPSTREGVKVVNLFDIKAMFGESQRKKGARLNESQKMCRA